MGEAFHQGGWGMYPTAIAGLAMLVAAVQYARQPDRRRLGLVRALGMLTFLVSCLGFVTGVIKTFTSLGDVEALDVGRIALMGVGESLNNLGLGLVALVMASIVVVVGKHRAAPAELADPHP